MYICLLICQQNPNCISVPAGFRFISILPYSITSPTLNKYRLFTIQEAHHELAGPFIFFRVITCRRSTYQVGIGIGSCGALYNRIQHQEYLVRMEPAAANHSKRLPANHCLVQRKCLSEVLGHSSFFANLGECFQRLLR